MKKPVVYISSPYTNGDPAINVRFQCETFDRLLSDGLVWPFCPLVSHFQHVVFPRSYMDWMAYDLGMIESLNFEACLRLVAEYEEINYKIEESHGADRDVQRFLELGRPVFYSIDSLYKWVTVADI